MNENTNTQLNERIIEMFKIQDDLNAFILDKKYKEQSIPFYRAAIVEAAELYEHTGYKWWKKTDELDIQQAQLEIVDIWHFLMSELMSSAKDQEEMIKSIQNMFNVSLKRNTDSKQNYTKENRLNAIDEFIKVMSTRRVNAVYDFVQLMNVFNLSFDELYRTYISKNALNYFRQNNGYKTGEYIKERWLDKNGNEVEDNVVLSEIQEGDWNCFQDIYDKLSVRYNQIQK